MIVRGKKKRTCRSIMSVYEVGGAHLKHVHQIQQVKYDRIDLSDIIEMQKQSLSNANSRNISPIGRKKEDAQNIAEKNRFKFTRSVMAEFNLEEHEIPFNMREKIPQDSSFFVDFLERNINYARNAQEETHLQYVRQVVKGVEKIANADEKRKEVEMQRRNSLVENHNKWNSFRERRSIILDLYIKRKKKQARALEFLHLMCLH